ncbi:MAG: glycerol-3-phosphate acyltransferase, partial [Frankiales bacterium]|nr:glycerol-3-phosphate acyltransferase [Frankiales bacterium]
MTAQPAPLSWPAEPGQPVVLLTERLSPVERDLFDSWLERESPLGAGADVVHIPQEGRLDTATSQALERHLARDDDPLFVPIGVRWTGSEASKSGSPITALLMGDPRRPWAMAQKWLAHKHPGSPQLLAGRSARASEIRQRFDVQVGAVDEPQRFARYVSRHATLALEQAAAKQLGPSYKIPRLVKQEVADSARFQAALRAVADKVSRPLPDVLKEAEADLDEL